MENKRNLTGPSICVSKYAKSDKFKLQRAHQESTQFIDTMISWSYLDFSLRYGQKLANMTITDHSIIGQLWPCGLTRMLDN